MTLAGATQNLNFSYAELEAGTALFGAFNAMPCFVDEHFHMLSYQRVQSFYKQKKVNCCETIECMSNICHLYMRILNS